MRLINALLVALSLVLASYVYMLESAPPRVEYIEKDIPPYAIFVTVCAEPVGLILTTDPLRALVGNDPGTVEDDIAFIRAKAAKRVHIFNIEGVACVKT